ncbi:hypothetical protein KCU62_g115, partial [Aureobasidium sp. EXF-3399]
LRTWQNHDHSHLRPSPIISRHTALARCKEPARPLQAFRNLSGGEEELPVCTRVVETRSSTSQYSHHFSVHIVRY